MNSDIIIQGVGSIVIIIITIIMDDIIINIITILIIDVTINIILVLVGSSVGGGCSRLPILFLSLLLLLLLFFFITTILLLTWTIA